MREAANQRLRDTPYGLLSVGQRAVVDSLLNVSAGEWVSDALERNVRLTARVRQLEKRLSEELGATVWAESGLGAPVDLDQLQRRITMIEKQLVDKQGDLEERTEELKAARAANQALTRALNHRL
ncbi:hypothetical protein [Streptomyces sp. NPDC059970]|uniref:hypothetical protein n=1 Tax=Streptomyces sp. NPDC059970 TaxID=3347019 RepID=UPI00369B3ECB